MDQQVGVKVNVEVLRERLSQERGRILSYQDAFDILISFGMKQQGDLWILDCETDMTFLQEDEIEAIGPASQDGLGKWKVSLLPLSAVHRKMMGDITQSFAPPARKLESLEGTAAASVCVPAAFLGTPQTVRQRGTSLIRKVVRNRNWSVAHNPSDMVRISDLSGDICVSESVTAGSGNNVLLYTVLRTVLDETERPDRRQWYDLQKQIILSGLDFPWFCMAIVGGGEWLICMRDMGEEESTVARAAMQKILKHWPVLCALDSRMVTIGHRGWPCWCCRVLTLACHLGATRETLDVLRKSDVVTVGRMLHGILAASTTNGGDSGA